MAPCQIIFKVRLYAYLRVYALQDASPENGRLAKISVVQIIHPKIKMFKFLTVYLHYEFSKNFRSWSIRYIYNFFQFENNVNSTTVVLVKEADLVITPLGLAKLVTLL